MPKIYRGFRDPLSSTKQKSPFLEIGRKPKNLPEFVHTAADQWFQHRFQLSARSRSLMCSTDITQARSFSKYVYQVIPIEPFVAIYSKHVRDFIEILVGGPPILTQTTIWDYLASQEYTQISSIHEISDDFFGEVMLICEEFTIADIN